MYTLAASAAGVEMLALVQPAQAKIIYTRVHTVIQDSQSYSLDLNHDGITDFTIHNNKSRYAFGVFETSPPRNSVIGFRSFVGTGSVWCASALSAGAGIGPSRKFTNGTSGLVGIFASGVSFGVACVRWGNVANRYLGLTFQVQGKVHYGWARLSVVRVQGGIKVTLTGYAYESIANKPIIAGNIVGESRETGEKHIEQPNPISLASPTPEPATLGALAMGAPGLSIWRRENLVGERR